MKVGRINFLQSEELKVGMIVWRDNEECVLIKIDHERFSPSYTVETKKDKRIINTERERLSIIPPILRKKCRDLCVHLPDFLRGIEKGGITRRG